MNTPTTPHKRKYIIEKIDNRLESRCIVGFDCQRQLELTTTPSEKEHPPCTPFIPQNNSKHSGDNVCGKWVGENGRLPSIA